MDKIIEWLKWGIRSTYGLTIIEVENNPAWKKVESILLGEIDGEYLKSKSLDLSKLSDFKINELDARSFLFQFLTDWLNKGVKS